MSGTATAIENITMEEALSTTDDAWYTITGIRITSQHRLVSTSITARK